MVFKKKKKKKKKKDKVLLKIHLMKKVFIILPSNVCCGFGVRLSIFFAGYGVVI